MRSPAALLDLTWSDTERPSQGHSDFEGLYFVHDLH